MYHYSKKSVYIDYEVQTNTCYLFFLITVKSVKRSLYHVLQCHVTRRKGLASRQREPRNEVTELPVALPLVGLVWFCLNEVRVVIFSKFLQRLIHYIVIMLGIVTVRCFRCILNPRSSGIWL